jgi:multiple sugar transport system ATP-binding protein
VMNRGVLQQIGAPRTLYHQPANLFVASFIGSPAISLIEGAIIEGKTGHELALGADRLPLPATLLDQRPAIAEYVGRKIVVGLRPETLTVGAQGNPSRGAITGVVAFIEDLGASLLVHFDVEAPPPQLDGDGLGVDEAIGEISRRGGRVRAMVDGFASIRAGERLPIGVDLERLHLFDRRTGVAI